MLTKLEKAKLLHKHEHYKINEKIALKNGLIEIAREYKIKLETTKDILDIFEIKPYEDNKSSIL